MQPKITIITIARNEEKHIYETLSSIKNQTFVNFECLIIDGDSTDRTPLIAQEFIEADERFKFFLQKSAGISNAFNEGISLASGNFIIFLNAGDILNSENSLMKLIDYTQQHPASIICAKTEYIEENGIRTGRIFPTEVDLNKSLYWSCTPAHQSTLIPMYQMTKAGGYSPCFKIAMDYELWLRLLKQKCDFIAFDEVIAKHRIGGISFLQLNRSRLEVVLARWLNLSFIRKSLFKDFIQLFLVLIGLFKK